VRGLLCAFAVTIALTLSGCGGDGESGSGDAKDEPSASPAASYFVKADTDAINAALVQAQKAGARAQAPKAQAACNKAGDRGYEAWRTCWHNLLNPFEKALTDLASRLKTLSGRDFSKDCVAALGAAEEAFTTFAAVVDGLRSGIDSKRRATQVRTLRIYDATLGEISKGFAEPFQVVVQACYSPKDLARIQASPSPSASD